MSANHAEHALGLDARLLRFLTRPIGRQSHHRLTKERVGAAVAVVSRIVASETTVQETVERHKQSENDPRGLRAMPSTGGEWIEFLAQLFATNRISRAEYVFSLSLEIPGLGEDHLSDAELPLVPSTVLEWYNADREAFRALRERGRRKVFHDSAYTAALRDQVELGYTQARQAADAGAYLAGVTLLAASIEGLLIMRCLKSPSRAKALAASLPQHVRPRARQGIGDWRFLTLIGVCEVAGWLPVLELDAAQHESASMATQLRIMRNWIHPARAAKDRPWLEVSQEEFQLAEALYVLVYAIVRRPRLFRGGLSRSSG